MLPTLQKVLSFCTALLMCAGCVPLPHFETQTPHVDGDLYDGGKPIANAEIRLSRSINDILCKTPDKISRTNQQGHFEIDAIKEFRFTRTLIGDPFFFWSMCISANGKTYLGSMHGGVGYSPETTKLRCTVSLESQEVDSSVPENVIHNFAICADDSDI